MSERYPGGLITKTPVTPTGPYQSGTAPGVWTLDQQLQYQQQGIWPTAGLLPNYIEDVFSTYLYTGTNASQTITNGIDLSTKGGMVWTKTRSAVNSNTVWDTARGVKNLLITNQTAANLNIPVSYPAYPDYGLQTFNTNGFTLGKDWEGENSSGTTEVSWTFRKQAKFFDVVTYTGNGGTLSVSHSLASKPGCIIIKRTDSTSDWLVCTRKSNGNIYAMYLNTTAGQFYDGTEGSLWTSTAVSINWINSNVASGFNTNTATYVMYLFAHDAGGFGLSGTDNVISCGSGSWSGGADNVVNLGYEAQWVMYKPTSAAGNWMMFDIMRGMSYSSSEFLRANLSDAAGTYNSPYAIYPTATGFTVPAGLVSTGSYIYIAIRRGPMKTPTSGTSVFSPVTYTGNGSSQTITSPAFAPDMLIGRLKASSTAAVVDKLRGRSVYLYTSNTDADTSTSSTEDVTAFTNTGFSVGTDNRGNWNTSSESEIVWTFGRAPGFFDVVCYTGTGSNTTQTHNLGVAPELMIVKRRSATGAWQVYSSALSNTEYLVLDTTAAKATGTTRWNSTTPTSSVFSIGTDATVNASAGTYVAYLFATVAGVSKVGSYTGTGTTKQIDCGFTGGARFVLIKRTNSTGDWYVWDSARGIVAGNDPYLLLNSVAAEVTNTDYVDTYSAGFEISSTAPAAINANGGTFIFLAIA